MTSLFSFADDTARSSRSVTFASDTKIGSNGLIPCIEDNTITYDLGFLNVSFHYKVRLQLPHEYTNKNLYQMHIPFEHTSNITVMNVQPVINGHCITIKVHPQKQTAVKLHDFIDIQFIEKLIANEDQSENESEYESSVISVASSNDMSVDSVATPNSYCLKLCESLIAILERNTNDFEIAGEKYKKNEYSNTNNDIESGNDIKDGIDADGSSIIHILRLQINAKILKRNQGTPILKPGIVCIRSVLNDETDCSDANTPGC